MLHGCVRVSVVVATGVDLADLRPLEPPTVEAPTAVHAAARQPRLRRAWDPESTPPRSIGRVARDVLARMAPAGIPVRIVGAAAEAFPLPAAPSGDRVVCSCMGTTLADLQEALTEGMRSLSSSSAHPGQDSARARAACACHTCAPSSPRGPGRLPSRSPRARRAADHHRRSRRRHAHRRVPPDALHDEHLVAGRADGPIRRLVAAVALRRAVAEYWAVREGVSIGDVSTLGKLIVSGPDVVEALERLYPCHVADIRPGRSRYALLLNERGHVMDDGMILRDAETRFTLTFTSGGAANAEMWIRDWIERGGCGSMSWIGRVARRDQCDRAARDDAPGALGLPDAPRWLGHVRTEVAGVPCHVMRLSFTGEASFELHHPFDGSVALWRSLLTAGADLGIRPHGLQALFGLRLEKGHVIVGMDTELDTTPRRLGMDWAARMDKPEFIGRSALARTAPLDDDRRWMGFAMDGPAPTEGTPIRVGDAIVGNVTGSWTSPALGKALMLGWQRRRPFADRVEIDGREAIVTPTPFYDPEGARARA